MALDNAIYKLEKSPNYVLHRILEDTLAGRIQQLTHRPWIGIGISSTEGIANLLCKDTISVLQKIEDLFGYSIYRGR